MTNPMNRRQTLLTLLYLPLHLFAVPFALGLLWDRGLISLEQANAYVYAVGAVVMLTLLHGFFRRDFDALCEHRFLTLRTVLSHYGYIFLSDIVITTLFESFGLTQNANNDAINSMAESSYGVITAMAVCMAPFVEEPIFRGALFGPLRKRSRLAAYLVSALAFSLYHVIGDALSNPVQLLYLLEYLPGSLLLAHCYEKTDSIWGPVFLHMLNNAVGMLLLHP